MLQPVDVRFLLGGLVRVQGSALLLQIHFTCAYPGCWALLCAYLLSLLHIYGISAESSVKCSYLFIVSDCWNVHLNRPALAEPKIMGVTSPDTMTGSELVICCLRTQHPIWRDELAVTVEPSLDPAGG